MTSNPTSQDPSTVPSGGLGESAAPDAADLAQALSEQPDGPNVAPSPLERYAAQGELPLTGRHAGDMAEVPSAASPARVSDADPSGASNPGGADEHPPA